MGAPYACVAPGRTWSLHCICGAGQHQNWGIVSYVCEVIAWSPKWERLWFFSTLVFGLVTHALSISLLYQLYLAVESFGRKESDQQFSQEERIGRGSPRLPRGILCCGGTLSPFFFHSYAYLLSQIILSGKPLRKRSQEKNREIRKNHKLPQSY